MPDLPLLILPPFRGVRICTSEVKMGALDGLKVIDVSRVLPAPFCATLLADHGADVIEVEAPHFRTAPLLGQVPMLRRNKRHMSLDLKTHRGREVFFKLVTNADVVLEGFRPGVADRLGIGYETVRAKNRRIIYCSLTGYGQSGPLSLKAGHDLNYMAVAGMLDLIRDGQGVPIMPNFQMSYLSGSLYAAFGILLAIAARERTGEGQYVDVSMTDGLVSLLAIPLSFTFSGATLPGKPDNDTREWFACYRIYQTRDGEHLSVGPLESHLWTRLCIKLGCPQFAPLQYDRERQSEIVAQLERLFLTRNLAEWMDLLSDPDDCVAPVTRVKNLPESSHFLERAMIRKPESRIPEPGIAPVLSETPGAYCRPEYCFGQHTREILKELGYGRDEIPRMEADGVVWSKDDDS